MGFNYGLTERSKAAEGTIYHFFFREDTLWPVA